MIPGYRTTRIFAEKSLREYLDERRSSITQSIENENDDYLLNINEADYIEYKKNEAYVEPLVIHDDQTYASSSEQMIPAEYFPQGFHVRKGDRYKKDVIRFHVPVSGNLELIKCKPNTCIMWSMNIELANDEFCFEVINFRNNAKQIKESKDHDLQTIAKQLINVTSQVEQYNSAISTWVRQSYESRKQKILSKNGILAELGVPIKKAENVSPTFSIPTARSKREVVIEKPNVIKNNIKPDPALDEATYHEILNLIHDVGKEFERLPSLYIDKEEEHLRDHFLMMLEPNFQGSATGETFNKKGKTDILLRHEGKNVFIAECKFWHGKKGFLDTISQLLGYLTWRDSKAAVIVFVPNKNFTSVLEIAKDVINQHPNFLEFNSTTDETWFNYYFHLNDDDERKIQLAVMLYHLPKTT